MSACAGGCIHKVKVRSGPWTTGYTRSAVSIHNLLVIIVMLPVIVIGRV